MLKAEFDKVRREAPHIVAVFRVNKLPNWVDTAYVAVGDEVYWSNQADSFRTMKKVFHGHRMNTGLSPSYVKFLRYEALK